MLERSHPSLPPLPREVHALIVTDVWQLMAGTRQDVQNRKSLVRDEILCTPARCGQLCELSMQDLGWTSHQL